MWEWISLSHLNLLPCSSIHTYGWFVSAWVQAYVVQFFWNKNLFRSDSFCWNMNRWKMWNTMECNCYPPSSSALFFVWACCSVGWIARFAPFCWSMYVHDDDLKDEVLNWVNSILGMLYIILPKRIFSKNNAKVRFSRETTKGNNRKMRYFYQKNCFKEFYKFCCYYFSILVEFFLVAFHKLLLMESM